MPEARRKISNKYTISLTVTDEQTDEQIGLNNLSLRQAVVQSILHQPKFLWKFKKFKFADDYHPRNNQLRAGKGGNFGVIFLTNV